MRFRLLSLVFVLASLVPSRTAQSAPVVPAPLCFNVSSIRDCVDPQFRAYWEANGGLAVFGYPLSAALPEQTADGLWTTQHFERNRLELHSGVAAPWTIQLGRLGGDRLGQLGRDWKTEPTATDTANCRFFPETKHRVCEPFLSYWHGHGLDLGDRDTSERESLALWGLPLTGPQTETNGSGDRVTTQWFERGRFEDHDGVVILGRLGAEVDAAKRPPTPRAGFVQVRGDHVVMGEQTVQLKGVNYYPQQHAWSYMWQHWDAPQVERDLARMEHQLQANTVRILVPYNRVHEWTDGRGNVNPVMLDRVKQFVQIAGVHNLKVIVTLFDWHGMIEPELRSYERAYLATIIGAFRDDDRVLMWDIHNEPDNYGDWKQDRAATLDWLLTTADDVHALDRNHPLTVGVGHPATLWLQGTDGRTLLDVSDIVSVHGYDAAQYDAIFADVRRRTTKPMLLEEFGWPSGPECVIAFRDEPSQLFLFQKAITSINKSGVVGGLSWWLEDPIINAWFQVADEGAYFGVYRKDGTPKPALAVMRGWAVAPLPSQTTSKLALTVVPVPPPHPLNTPIMFGDIVLIGSFKHFWNFFGGEATFGKPITQMFREQNGMLVQYFEHARFELNESEHVQPIDPTWPEGQTDAVYLDRVHITPLGKQLTANRQFAPIADPKQADVQFFPQTGHTLRGGFRMLWQTHGEPFFGLPLSEEIKETINGQQRTVQYFEKWRMERWADGSVHLGNLGSEGYAARTCVRGW